MKYKIKIHFKKAGIAYLIFIPMLFAIVSAEVMQANLEKYSGFYVLGVALCGAIISWYIVIKILMWVKYS